MQNAKNAEKSSQPEKLESGRLEVSSPSENSSTCKIFCECRIVCSICENSNLPIYTLKRAHLYSLLFAGPVLVTLCTALLDLDSRTVTKMPGGSPVMKHVLLKERVHHVKH